MARRSRTSCRARPPPEALDDAFARRPWALACLAALALAALALAAPALAGKGDRPLFAEETPIHVALRGPIQAIAHHANTSTDESDGSLAVAGEGAALPIKLSARGRTRRQSDACEFPPLRVTFPESPGSGALFEGQKSLKLVTHCRADTAFQQYVLLEYSVYRMYNLVTPQSFRARLAAVDYLDPGGRKIVSRLGYFLEDEGDVAKRNGLKKAKVGDRIARGRLDAAAAGRVAAFEYLIGNLDWSMIASPTGENCCHNVKLIAPEGAQAGLTPVPYDFDQTGVVDTPYAAPPTGVVAESVRDRRFRGYCTQTAEARAGFAELAARREAILAVLNSTPQLADGPRRRAAAYLGDAFGRLSTPAGVDRVLAGCIR